VLKLLGFSANSVRETDCCCCAAVRGTQAQLCDPTRAIFAVLLGPLVVNLWLSVLCMRSKAWLAVRVTACGLPRTASSAQSSRRLRSVRAAAPVLLAHAVVTKTIIFSMGPKLRHPTVVPRARHCQSVLRVHTLRFRNFSEVIPVFGAC
jgi:hypothetical protein